MQTWSKTPGRWRKACGRRASTSYSGGTDNHLSWSTQAEGLKGNVSEKGAGARGHHLQQERHSVRSGKPFVTSGLRLGTPAATTRGLASPNSAGRRNDRRSANAVRSRRTAWRRWGSRHQGTGEALTDRFPIYQ